MDSFETVVATILERDGFWVRTSFKVKLSKVEKREIKRPSSPRWELDVVGYRAGDNLLRVVECKSYLDSGGVNISAFDPTSRFSGRFKLFNEPTTREVGVWLLSYLSPKQFSQIRELNCAWQQGRSSMVTPIQSDYTFNLMDGCCLTRNGYD